MRYWLAHFGLIGMSVAFLVHFGMIAKEGQVTIQEPNKAILYSEIALISFFLLLGITNIGKMAKNEQGVKRIKSKRKAT